MKALGFAARGLRRLRRALSRNEWSLRLLRLPKVPLSDAPGLVLIQIDGLAHPQLERALRKGRMRFLHSQLRHRRYNLHSVYSGLPSTTPAAQAELFYRVKGAVPAFCYHRRRDGGLMNMLRAECAEEIEIELEKKTDPLLRGGSGYSNIYTGGAAEPHFCASRLSMSHLMRETRLWRVVAVTALNFFGIFRLALLLAVEAVFAVADAVRGVIAFGEYRQEFLFLFSRVLVCVGLREVMTAMACVDLTRGLPLVQLNFNGYDEQSHRRGPSSALAHYSLRGIDRSISRIFSAARRSLTRKYEVWIYSDHGQETALPYYRLHGESLEDVVRRCVDQAAETGKARKPPGTGSQDPTGARLEKILLRPRHATDAEAAPPPGNVQVAALGPVAHVYLPPQLGLDPVALAHRLAEHQVPMALIALEDGTVKAYTVRGEFTLPQDAGTLLGTDHRFLSTCAEDLIALCRHRDAGDLVLLGWNPKEKPVTFAYENGAHGGPGFAETHAFALLPRSHALTGNSGPARLSDLHDLVRRVFPLSAG